MSKGYVYCIGGDYGPVKVGYSVNPEKRVQDFQTGNSLELRVLAKREGGLRCEYEAHRALRNHWVRGEWFKRKETLAYFGVDERGSDLELARLQGFAVDRLYAEIRRADELQKEIDLLKDQRRNLRASHRALEDELNALRIECMRLEHKARAAAFEGAPA